MTNNAQATLSTCRSKLAAFREDLVADPLANPVRRLSHELSQAIEGGTLTLDDTAAMIDLLSAEAAGARAERGRAYLAAGGTINDAAERLVASAKSAEELQALLQRPLETIVFTGHPTFAMGPGGGEALREGESLDHATAIRASISLAEEHREACQALQHGANAAAALSKAVITKAEERFGEEARGLHPQAVGLATWVGYDLDGRQDIGWTRIFHHRLTEKALALRDYAARLARWDAAGEVLSVRDALELAAEETEETAALFSDDDALQDAHFMAQAANRLTAEGAGRLTSLKPQIARLRAAAEELSGEEAAELLAVAALMDMRGLGLGEIHFRLNASQVRNAARALMPIAREADLFGRSALTAAGEAIRKVDPVQINFGSLARETSSARRIAMASAQIIKHVDEDAPIRLLIAECENPVTVLTAIYLLKRYGADAKVDVCPLFETAKSFDRSRRILNVLLGQEAYQEQVRRRGRITVEAGFSDAGRFMGQLPATLAIERLQVQLANEMKSRGLTGLEAVVFNTHGESMGRGGHPGSILDRSRYCMSPFARRAYSQHAIRLGHEISFQGGDGYAWFATDAAAEQVLSGLIRARTIEPEALDDHFYERTEASLDFYNTVRTAQIDLFHQEAIASVVMGPGLALLPPAGSRKTKRQFERKGEEDLSLRRIRAISHNGSLQQIGYLANIHAGVGEAIGTEPEAYAELAQQSDRFRRLMDLAAHAAGLSDMKTMIAYMKLYDGSFWATRPISGVEPGLESACADLAAHLVGDRRYFAALEMAARLRPGAIQLKRGLKAMGYTDIGRAPVNLDLLHALRLALIQHMFLLGARLPAFVEAGGFSRPEVLDEILALEIPSAVAQLRQRFRSQKDPMDGALFDEPADQNEKGPDYERIEEETIAPLERSFQQCRRISLAVAHHFAAHG